MPNDAEMTIDERRNYLKGRQGRSWAVAGRERNRVLTEMEVVTGLPRRSVVRLVWPHGPGLARRQRAKQRRLTRFGQDVPRLPRRGPARANGVNQVRRAVPRQRMAWEEPEPGHFCQ